ncbi:hypothetical protein DdX_19976 [Ditylenchus destructor]|uniref:Uncharacterized protein n=1 Tax=Ditylenchus destructor TaxID=166010 RepID=A0AAD4MHZ9_9BILA|nr:hypothetical protein DdX_19976 [Ditylenchus destructor]
MSEGLFSTARNVFTYQRMSLKPPKLIQIDNYRLRDKRADAKGEIKQCIDGQQVLIQFDSKSGVIFDEVKQVDVEQNGKSGRSVVV